MPFRWRLVLLVGAAIAVLSIAGVLTSYQVVRNSLLTDLQASLREDAQRVAALYGGGEAGSADGELSGPTGGVVITLFDTTGSFLATSGPLGEDFAQAIPRSIIAGTTSTVTEWQGESRGRQLLAALAPFGVGVAAVISETTFISGALNQIARVLTVLGVILVAASGVFAWIIAGQIMQPLRRLAREASRLGPDNLQPVSFQGANDELGLLSSVLNQLIDRLKIAIDGQRQFLLETSHELRTPLTSLSGFLDRGLRRATPESEPEIQAARRIASNMGRLVEDLLQLTRGQSVRELVPHLVDPFGDVIEAVAGEFPGVRIQGESGSMLIGDPGRLRQLVRNLTSNAMRAAGAEGVELECRAEGGMAVLTVRDFGPGIPDYQQTHIFEKFYRGAGGGAGLGLAIARQIAEQHSGSIRLESRPGLTEFIVELPLVDA